LQNVLRTIYRRENFTAFHEYVLEARRLAVLRKFYNRDLDPGGWREHIEDTVWGRDHLINPLLLCTALSAALHSERDIGWFVGVRQLEHRHLRPQC
jgi:hypothetical protein